MIEHFTCNSYACGVPDPDTDELIITGGWDTLTTGGLTTVSVYTEAGWQRDLPPMAVGRRQHACASFKDGVKKGI